MTYFSDASLESPASFVKPARMYELMLVSSSDRYIIRRLLAPVMSIMPRVSDMMSAKYSPRPLRAPPSSPDWNEKTTTRALAARMTHLKNSEKGSTTYISEKIDSEPGWNCRKVSQPVTARPSSAIH